MTMICGCPVGAEIPDIVLSSCPEIIGQVQKVIFTRIFSSGTTKNGFVISSADPALKASWTPKLAASDGTKVVQSPFIEAPTFEAGAARKTGGGNNSLGGIQRVIGSEPTSFKGVITNSPQSVIKSLKSYMCEKIGVFYVNEMGRLVGAKDSTGLIFQPIPIHALFVGDKKIGGLEEDDQNVIEFSMLPNWSDTLHVVTPTDFDALNDLVNS